MDLLMSYDSQLAYLSWLSDLLADDLPLICLIFFDRVEKGCRLLPVSLYIVNAQINYLTSSSANSA